MPTVLVVDDEPIVRDVVVRYLERDGFQTLVAADGDTAREMIERSQPQLVVLDVMLPGTDGLALCRWIRSRGRCAFGRRSTTKITSSAPASRGSWSFPSDAAYFLINRLCSLTTISAAHRIACWSKRWANRL